ncbi:hypothetical protein LPJ59_005844 [Coemansia sp. RSA 2399]|nr:hypothetical protein LPJ59_005844 [Coemansia sp. RSA 2399]KAJ1891576.1 hypothetical protein LPJ81_005719 [Coemansia sp. IMI 209127]
MTTAEGNAHHNSPTNNADVGAHDSSDEIAMMEGAERGQSPRSTRRIRNRLAAARMRNRQKQHLEELEQRKRDLELRAAELEDELRATQSQNNPVTSSIDTLATMIDDLTSVEQAMLSGIDECKSLLQNLEAVVKKRNRNKDKSI